jgi:GT2 family glycosyltransferase
VSAALPSVSVVVVNWNGRAFLSAALPSIAALDYPRELVELIVVDNGSTDGSVAWLRATWPAVRVLAYDRNLGFAAANNAAAATAAGDVLALLNNDLRVDPAWLRCMVEGMRATGAAAAGSRILDWEGARYDHDGAAMSFDGHGTSRRHGRCYAGEAGGLPSDALFACGAAMLVARERFLASGGFDPDYFAYFEDVDLGWRLWVEGARVVHVPAAVAYHRHHGSGLPAERRTRLLERNALAGVVKNYDDASLARVLPAALLLVAARARLAGGERAAPYRDTLARFLAELPRWRAKRAVVQASRRRPDREILPLFVAPLRPSFFGAAYWREQASVVAAFDIGSLFGDGGDMAIGAGLEEFIAELQSRIAELDAAASATGERLACVERDAAAERARHGAERARLVDELARLRAALEQASAPPKRLWRR